MRLSYQLDTVSPWCLSTKPYQQRPLINKTLSTETSYQQVWWLVRSSLSTRRPRPDTVVTPVTKNPFETMYTVVVVKESCKHGDHSILRGVITPHEGFFFITKITIFPELNWLWLSTESGKYQYPLTLKETSVWTDIVKPLQDRYSFFGLLDTDTWMCRSMKSLWILLWIHFPLNYKLRYLLSLPPSVGLMKD